ncbi:unnamed protein product [Caretta caretta]
MTEGYCRWRGCRLVRSAIDTSDGSRVSKTEYLEDFHMWSSVCCHPFCSCFTHTQRLTICLVLLLSYTCLNTVLAHLKQEERINKVNSGEQCKATRESRIHSIEGMDNAQNWHDSTAKNVVREAPTALTCTVAIHLLGIARAQIFIIALVVAWRNRGHSNFFAEALHDATKHLVSETGHVPKNYVSHSYLCFHDPAIEFEKNSLCPSESMVLTTGLPCFICTEAKDRIKKINSPNNIRHLGVKPTEFTEKLLDRKKH